MPIRRGRPCSICQSPHRRRVERDFAKGKSVAEIRAEYGEFSRDALYRHAKSHLGLRPTEILAENAERTTQRNVERGQENHRQRLLAIAAELTNKSIALMHSLQDGGDLRGAVVALRTAMDGVLHEAKLTGVIDGRAGEDESAGGKVAQCEVVIYRDWKPDLVSGTLRDPSGRVEIGKILGPGHYQLYAITIGGPEPEGAIVMLPNKDGAYEPAPPPVLLPDNGRGPGSC